VTFTSQHRGGSGSPLVLLHGFLDTWRAWELVLPALEREHDVLALTLPGHAGGPPQPRPLGLRTLADEVERALDAAGFETAHLVGNSLGGHLALQLAERDRARTVVALAPAGGWTPGDEQVRAVFDVQADLVEVARSASVHAPSELLAHQLRGIAAVSDPGEALAVARAADWSLDPSRILVPVRIVWGTADRLLPWPQAAERYRRDWLPHADWVELDGVGHAPQLEVPLETAQLVLGWTSSSSPYRRTVHDASSPGGGA
jgi:pimeloyl-ACP methyl ester carboxylesterase